MWGVSRKASAYSPLRLFTPIAFLFCCSSQSSVAVDIGFEEGQRSACLVGLGLRSVLLPDIFAARAGARRCLSSCNRKGIEGGMNEWTVVTVDFATGVGDAFQAQL